MFRRAQAVQEANQALSEERQHLRGLFEQAPGFMAALSGPDHVFTMANAAYLQLVGRENVIGKPVREALPEVVEQGFLDLLDRVYRSGQPFVGRSIRIVLEQDAGGGQEERFLDFVYQPIFDPSGQVSGIFVQGHDVTEQKRTEEALRESEERFRVIANSIDQMIWATQPDGYHDYYNQRWYEFTGVPDGLHGRRGMERHVPSGRSGTRLEGLAPLPGDGRALSYRVPAAASLGRVSLGARAGAAGSRRTGPDHALVRQLHRYP